MINKLGLLVFKKERKRVVLGIVNFSFIFSMFFFLILPYFSEKFYITEKQMKVSEHHLNDFKDNSCIEDYQYLTKQSNNRKEITEDIIARYNELKLYLMQEYNNTIHEEFFFIEYVKRLFRLKIKNTKPSVFEINLNKKNSFSNENIDKHFLLNYKILSPRGDRSRYIMINFILDMNQSKHAVTLSSGYLFIVFSLLNHFQNASNSTWLAKDLYINIISKEAFYNNALELNDFFNNHNYFNQEQKDFILNLDLDRPDYTENFLIQFVGSNSEAVDMDYYKLVYDNLLNGSLTDKQIRINTEIEYNSNFNSNNPDKYKKILNSNRSKYLTSIINFIDEKANSFNVIKPYTPITSVKFNYKNQFTHMIKNIFSNYLIDYKINLNNILVSEGINSILLKNISNNNNDDKKIKISDHISFIKSFERIIKGLSIAEIDIFRGSYHYFFTTNTDFIGMNFFILVMVFSIFIFIYEVFDLYDEEMNSKKNNAGFIALLFIFLFSFGMIFICEMCYSFTEIIGYMSEYMLLICLIISGNYNISSNISNNVNKENFVMEFYYKVVNLLLSNSSNNSIKERKTPLNNNNINDIQSLINSTYFNYYYIFLFSVSLIFLLMLSVMYYKLKNQIQRRIFMNVNLINSCIFSFNFFSVNYGLGLIMAITVLLNEFLTIINTISKGTDTFFKKILSILKTLYTILMLYILLFLDVIDWDTMIRNFILQPNNVFVIMTFIVLNYIVSLSNEIISLILKIK